MRSICFYSPTSLQGIYAVPYLSVILYASKHPPHKYSSGHENIVQQGDMLIEALEFLSLSVYEMINKNRI